MLFREYRDSLLEYLNENWQLAISDFILSDCSNIVRDFLEEVGHTDTHNTVRIKRLAVAWTDTLIKEIDAGPQDAFEKADHELLTREV